jgi:GTP pyrophosphokinase
MLSDSERTDLVKRYKQLLNLCRPYLRRGDTLIIRQAFGLAFDAYHDEKTFKGEPAIFYPLNLAEILTIEAGLGATSIATALLADVYRKGKIERKQVVPAVGPVVADILEGLKKISAIHTEKTALQTENFIHLLLSMAGDVRVILIRLADILYHLRNIEDLPPALRSKIANDAYYLYAPLAHRLGLYTIKTELEDLGMKCLFPEAYSLIVNKLKETADARKAFIASFIAPIKTTLQENGLDFAIKGRTKSVHSIWMKMLKQKVSFEDVYDILAIRIILKTEPEYEKGECWRAYSLVTDIYTPNPARLRDWISSSKASGYESLHTTVLGADGNWVEVQIRSQRMDDIAERGHAAHWKYKESKTGSDPDSWLRNLRDLIENPENQGLETQEQRQVDISPDTIYVFTPQGDLKKLKKGATVLDFAFEVHTGLGFKTAGAKVNGKNVPIRHVLENGDEVEIITTKNQKPKKDWLKFVNTSRAKAKIKKALKEEELKEAEAGKEILIRKFKSWKLTLNDETLQKAMKALKLKAPADLYQAIATEAIDVNRVRDILLVSPEKQEMPVPAEEPKSPAKTTNAGKEDYLIIDQNLANINYTLAHCCNPIFGDEVFGFVAIGKGITIHRTNCPNASELHTKFDYRIVNVRWRETSVTGSFQASIRVQGLDELGVVRTISDVISNDLKVNMRSISIESNKGVFDGLIKVYVSDNKILDLVIHKLLQIKGILRATRID